MLRICSLIGKILIDHGLFIETAAMYACLSENLINEKLNTKITLDGIK